MDEAKRKELEQRRAAQKARIGAPKPQGAIVRRLARCGVPHTLTTEGIWTPPYLQTTATRIYWKGSPSPARWDYCDTYRKRVYTIRGMIEEVVQPDDLLRFSYDSGYESNFTILARDALQRPVLSILLASTRTIWITSHPDQWLIEWGDYSTAQLAKPPPEWEARQAARDAAYFAPLTDSLLLRRYAYRLHERHAPDGPRPPVALMGLRMNGWSGAPQSLSAGIARGESSLGAVVQLRAALEPFLAEHATSDADIVVDLGHRASPKLTTGIDALLQCLLGVTRLLDEIGPDGPVTKTSLWLYQHGADWLVEITATEDYFTLRGLG